MTTAVTTARKRREAERDETRRSIEESVNHLLASQGLLPPPLEPSPANARAINQALEAAFAIREALREAIRKTGPQARLHIAHALDRQNKLIATLRDHR